MVETLRDLDKLLKIYKWMKQNDASVPLQKMKGFLSDLGCDAPDAEQKSGSHEIWEHRLLCEAPDHYFHPRILAEREPRYAINVVNKRIMHDGNVRKILEKVHVILRMLEDKRREE